MIGWRSQIEGQVEVVLKQQTRGLRVTGLRDERLRTAGAERRRAGEGLEKTRRLQKWYHFQE